MDYHNNRFDDHSLVISKKNKVIGLFPANQSHETIYSHEGLSYGGVLCDHTMKAAVMLELITAVASYYRQQGITAIIYKAIPAIYHQLPAEEDLYALTRLGAQLYRRDIASAIMSCTKSRNQLRSNNFKRNLTKAKKKGVSVAFSEDFASYHQILTEALSRHNAEPTHSLTELCKLQAFFPQNIKLLAAFHNQQMIAGAVLFISNQVIHTQYLANSAEGKLCGALDSVIEELINYCGEQKMTLSFGISTENRGEYLNLGLIRQKEGFGGRSIVHDFYRLELS